MDDTVLPIQCWVGAARSNDELCDQEEVVDEVFINLPSEDFTILVISSRSLRV